MNEKDVHYDGFLPACIQKLQILHLVVKVLHLVIKVLYMLSDLVVLSNDLSILLQELLNLLHKLRVKPLEVGNKSSSFRMIWKFGWAIVVAGIGNACIIVPCPM